MSPKKEPYYYRDHFSSPIASRGGKRSDYERLFDGVTNEKTIGEASPGYFWDSASPDLIKADVPDAKIIILIRDPGERAFSAWNQNIRSGVEKRTFSKAVMDQIYHEQLVSPDNGLQYVYHGMYAVPLKKYIRTFSEIRILIFEEFIKEPVKSVRVILQFLGIDAHYVDTLDYSAHNTAEGRRYRKGARSIMHSRISHLVPKRYRKEMTTRFLMMTSGKPILQHEDRKKLVEFYGPTVTEVEELLGRSLPWKRPNEVDTTRPALLK